MYFDAKYSDLIISIMIFELKDSKHSNYEKARIIAKKLDSLLFIVKNSKGKLNISQIANIESSFLKKFTRYISYQYKDLSEKPINIIDEKRFSDAIYFLNKHGDFRSGKYPINRIEDILNSLDEDRESFKTKIFKRIIKIIYASYGLTSPYL